MLEELILIPVIVLIIACVCSLCEDLTRYCLWLRHGERVG